MKIQSINSTTFNAGLTKQMRTGISSCNPDKIENYFAELGIYADFKKSKTAAWCSLQCLRIIQGVNRIYKLNLGYPKGVILENFDNLNLTNEHAFGITNFAPAFLYKNKKILVPERTIFYDTNEKAWNNLDNMENESLAEGISPTDFFLNSVLHEFMHTIHEANMLDILGGEKTIDALSKIQDTRLLESFQQKYAKKIKKHICKYAACNPLETVACDLTKRVVNSLDKENLTIKNNPLNSYPYRKIPTLNHSPISNLDKLLKSFWKGNFSIGF